LIVLGFSAFVIHFLFVTIYAYPFKGEKSRIQYWAQAYTYPFFRQGWGLFVPPPANNYQLFVEYEHDGVHKRDIFSEIVVAHQTNRLRGLEPVIIALSNSIYIFEQTTAHQAKLNGPIEDDIFFKIVEHVAKMYIQKTAAVRPVNPKVILLVTDARTGIQRAYYNSR
jgi:hypothetical protein